MANQLMLLTQLEPNMKTWTVNLEDKPRTLDRPEFYQPELARKGDKWHNPSRGIQEKLTVEYVTKYTDPNYDSTWYIITFSNPLPNLTSLHIGEGMGMGTFYQGETNEF